MHFLSMIFLRGDLMRITFDVGKVTVQEKIRTIPRTFGKLYILIRFIEYFDNKFEVYPFSKWQLSAIFLLKEYESELLRQENVSDIHGIAVPYMFKVEVYTCMLSKNGSFSENVIVIMFILLLLM